MCFLITLICLKIINMASKKTQLIYFKKKNNIALFIFIFSFFSSLAQWTQIGENILGENLNEELGVSVSISSDGSVLAAGAFGNDTNGVDSGAVRIYENQNGNWVQIGLDIYGEAEGDVSGISVCLNSDGSIVAIGATGNDGNGDESGHVRIYQNQNGIWVQLGMDINGEGEGDFSGFPVSLSSDGMIVAIGAYANSQNGSHSGHVRVFKYLGNMWVQIGDDIDADAPNSYLRSCSLNADGTKIVVGAFMGGSIYSGLVRIYENQNDIWVQVGNDLEGDFSEDHFGETVAFNSDGSIVAIAAPQNDTNGDYSGQVRVYKYDGNIWNQIGNDINGEAAFDLFGFSLAIDSDGSILVIGAQRNNGNGSQSGHARVFRNINNNWTQMGPDFDGDAEFDHLGISVSINSDGTIVALGANSNSENIHHSGQVKVFTYPSIGLNSLQEDYTIFPNPTSGVLYFDFSDYFVQELILTDITGKQYLHQTEFQQINKIDVSNLKNGIYFLSIRSSKNMLMSKIIKK